MRTPPSTRTESEPGTLLYAGRARRGLPALGAALALWLVPAPARGEPATLTRERVAALVTEAPEARVARSEAAVSAAAVPGSGALSLDNPVLSGMGGLRFNADGTRPFSGVANLAWPVELGGKRGARREAALSEQRAAQARLSFQTQKLLLAALLRHAAVLRDDRALELAAARRALSERVHAAAARRYAAGSVPELDVALAGLQETRDRSNEAAAAGNRDADKLALCTLLGLASDVAVRGSLVPEGDVPTLATLRGRIDERAEVRAADATRSAAQARAEREQSVRSPTVSLLAQYERDDRDDIGMLGLSIPLPLLNTNKSDIATSSAEVDTARARALATRSLVSGELSELHARYAATKAALDALAPAAALVLRAVNLATRSYELGEDDLSSVLLVRREALDAEVALLEAEHAHASTKIELLIAAGRIPR